MTDQLKQLSEAATPGAWTVNQRATFSVEAPERRGICSTGGYSDNRRDGEELFAENVANAAFTASTVRTDNMIYISTILGLEVMTLCLESDSFTLFDGDTIAADHLTGSEIEEAAAAYRISQS